MTTAISTDRSASRRPISSDSVNRSERALNIRESLRTIGDIRRATTNAGARYERRESGELYAAHTLNRLTRVSPRAAREFTARLEADLGTTNHAGGQPRLAAATDRVMSSLVRDGFIGTNVRTEIKRYALERAPTSAEQPRSATESGGKPTVSVADSIAAATRREANRTESTRSERTNSGGASSPKGPSIGIDAPSGFLWKPFSDSTGLLAILLAPSYTGDALSVEVLSPDGTTVLASGRPAGVANGGREHFRFDRPGSAFPPGSQVQVTRRDGTVERFTIPSPAIRNEGRGR